jgi:glycerol-3-phosphate dehydrogenase
MRRFCKIGILGSGAFGTAMAHAASFNPYNKV